jgi:hypothetical protein
MGTRAPDRDMFMFKPKADDEPESPETPPAACGFGEPTLSARAILRPIKHDRCEIRLQALAIWDNASAQVWHLRRQELYYSFFRKYISVVKNKHPCHCRCRFPQFADKPGGKPCTR